MTPAAKTISDELPAPISYNPIIVALDVSTREDAERLVRDLQGSVGAFKIGLELYNAVGPAIFDTVRKAADAPIHIFYDAKFHDIPNTVAGAIAAATKLNLWMINVHASGGSAMMRAAVDSATAASSRNGISKPLVIGVTVLTSIDAQTLTDELAVSASPQEQVVRLARLAQSSGCDGVVASPLEVEAIRAACGPDFLIVTPGVRPSGADAADQKRITTPADAIRRGATHLVIGRPITHAPSPKEAAASILNEIDQARL